MLVAPVAGIAAAHVLNILKQSCDFQSYFGQRMRAGLQLLTGAFKLLIFVACSHLLVINVAQA